MNPVTGEPVEFNEFMQIPGFRYAMYGYWALVVAVSVWLFI